MRGKFALSGQRIKRPDERTLPSGGRPVAQTGTRPGGRMERIFKKIVKWHTIQKTGLFKLSLVAFALLFLSCAEMPVFREEVFYPQIKQPAVTIKLLETKNSLTIRSSGSFVIRCFPWKGERSIYYASAEMLVKLSDGDITLDEKTQGELETNLHKVSFSPKEDIFWLYLNGKPYRGALEIISSKNPGSLLVLNLIFVEDYLKGVVPAEIGKLSQQEMEALKAQAIAARTYSLSRLGQHADRGYDLEASVADQIYKGVEGESRLVNRAVEFTRGEVLTHKGKLIHAYYHANSGGKTEYIERVWDKPKEDYLIAVYDKNFCAWSENYSWKESWSKETLKKNIKEFLDTLATFPDEDLGNILDLQIKQRSPSGRVEALDVVTESGSYLIRGDKIRWALKRGGNHNSILPSTRFDLEIQRDRNGSLQRVIARGRGNGHGVGMCQTGAIGMARKGYSYKDILRHYYPGVKITNCYGGNKLGV